MKVIIILFSFLNLFSCNDKLKKDMSETTLKTQVSNNSITTKPVINDSIIMKGVLIVNVDLLMETRDTIKIYNLDGNVYKQFFFDEKSQEITFKNNSSVNVRAFYPDYSLLYLDSSKENNFYEVIIDNEIKKIKFNDSLLYLEWNEFILKCIVSTTKYNGLKKKPNELSDSIVLVDYDNTSFIIKEVKGEWIRVECDIDCEGCPENKIITGWLRWKAKNRVLLKLYYTC